MAFLLAFLLSASPSRAAEPAETTAAADKNTLDLVNYFLKAELADANPKLVAPFLAVRIETLPKKLRNKALAKQIEIAGLVRLHDTKKAGSWIPPAVNCSEQDFVKPMSLASSFGEYEAVTEDELKYVRDKTKCTEIDLGCRFSMLIFYEKKKDRIVKFNPKDPIMTIIAESRHKTGTTPFFGTFMTCMH